MWYRIFGKKIKDEFDIPDKDYPDDNIFMERIKKICNNATINQDILVNVIFRMNL